MSSPVPAEPHSPSVFLSYASQDRPAAQALKEALRTYGLEVWYDESGLTGGDAWDQKIRRRIRECDYFMPLISAQTEARPEGYFRREWRLAVERTLDMADDHTFLLPVVIDGTAQEGARVPEKFLTVQWLRVPGGQPTAALEAVCRRLVSGEPAALPPAKKGRPAGKPTAGSPPRAYPEFPREEPGQRVRFWAHVLGWASQSAWVFFKGFPRWVRITIYVWIAVVLMSKGCMPSGRDSDELSPADARKVAAIADKHRGSKSDVAKLGAQIAREFADQASSKAGARSAVLAVPFTAPAGDAAAKKLADSAFAQVYGRMAISHQGQIALTEEPLSSLEPAVAAERGREQHSRYVLCGAVDAQSTAPSLIVKLVDVAGGSVRWSASYPVAAADPAKIASEVDSKIPRSDDD
jgi:TolB-like protein